MTCHSGAARCLLAQAIDRLRLDTDKPEAGARPKALGMESCVGVEYVPFQSPLPLEGKVGREAAGRDAALEHVGPKLTTFARLSCCCMAPQVEGYMGLVVDKMRSELRAVMGDSVRNYPAKPRERWMFDWPSQIALVSGLNGRGAVAREPAAAPLVRAAGRLILLPPAACSHSWPGPDGQPDVLVPGGGGGV